MADNKILPSSGRPFTEELEAYSKTLVTGNSWVNPPRLGTGFGVGQQGSGARAGGPSGTSLKDKDALVKETVDRLATQIAKLCNKYNFSDEVTMSTEVDLVETANYTTVLLTTTVEWLPNPYVFVAMEKIKTSNKTAVRQPPLASIFPSQQQLDATRLQGAYDAALNRQNPPAEKLVNGYNKDKEVPF